MKRFLPAAIVGLLLVALGIWWFSPTQVIKRRTRSFLNVLTIEESSGKPARQMKSFSFNGMVAEEVTLKNPAIEEMNGTMERGDLESGFSYLLNHAKKSEFKVEQFQQIEISDASARVDFVLDALVELPTYRPADGKYDVSFTWQKAKDGWRVSSIMWSEKKP